MPLLTNDEQLRRAMTETKTIAVIGLSPDSAKPSHFVPAYMQSKGYRIIPVNPTVDSVLGEKAYASLADVPEKVDMVDVFRRAEKTPPIVDEAAKIGAKLVWLQEGIASDEAAAKAEAHGLGIVMDKCLMKEHKRLFG
ncbi:MAG TPA: CoA-binding protein [Bacillota bacterium]|jgi:predicted CoA-binding protein